MNKMPVIFIGHGSPMNAIEENKFTQNWKKISKLIPNPKSILVISAHWLTEDNKVINSEKPRMIYDMYGFPESLYKIVYDAPGNPELAKKIKDLLGDRIKLDDTWGYDHGNWSVLNVMYPEKNIPVTQLSVNMSLLPPEQFEFGEKLRKLREEGVLVIASGNVVHNLRMINWNNQNGGYKWAEEFDTYIKEAIINREYDKVIDYKAFGNSADLSVPTTDHINPLLYILGMVEDDDKVNVYNDECVMGSLSMTCYVFDKE